MHQTPTTLNVRAFSLRQVSQNLGVSEGFLRHEIRRGNLRPTRLGTRVLLTDDELHRYIRANTPTAPAVV